MKKLIVFVSLCAYGLLIPLTCLASPPAIPATVKKPLAGDMLQTTIHRLKNGLTIYLSPNHQEPRVAAWIVVRAGSAQDPADLTGMAHYQEHMLFKGTKKMGTLDYEQEQPHLDKIRELYDELFATGDVMKRKELYAEIDRENAKAVAYAIPNEMDKAYRVMGFDGVNAFTGKEYTMYVCDMPANRAEAWARLESDRFAEPVFRLFNTELETVFEEKNRALDNAERILNEALGRALYQGHPYGYSTTLGEIEHLKNPSLSRMIDFYEDHYVPNNMAIALSGDFHPREMLKLIKKYFGSWVAKPLPKLAGRELSLPAGVERVEVKYEAEEKLMIAWQTVGKLHPDSAALAVMDMLMDNSTSGIINLELVQAQQLKAAGSYPLQYNDAGSWQMWALPKAGQTLEEAEGLLLQAVEKVKGGEFSEDDIKAIITDFEISEKMKLESNKSRVMAMASSFASFEEWEHAVERMDRFRAVSKEDVTRVAREYIGGNCVIAYRRQGKPQIPKIEKPGFSELNIDPSRQSEFFSEIVGTSSGPLAPRWLKEGRDYTVHAAEWGTLYTGENPINDLFSLSFCFKIGERRERRLAAALGLLGYAGAGELTAEKFKKELYRHGITMSFSSDDRSCHVSLSGLEEKLEQALALGLLRFRAPHIKQGTLGELVRIVIGDREDAKKDPASIHYALRSYAIRGDKSKVLNELSNQELEALETDELKELLAGLWGYQRDVLYVGKRPAKEVLALLAEKDTAYKPPPAYASDRFLRPEKVRILFAHREMIQSQVAILAGDELVEPRRIVDYLFFSEYLGGGMSGLIFQEIREARALAYLAGGAYLPGDWQGDENLIYGVVHTQADKTVEAAGLLLRLMRQPPMSAERFRETAQAIEQAYRTERVGFRAVPGTVLGWRDLGIAGGDPGPGDFEKVLRFQRSSLEKFAARFKGRPMTIAILGNRDTADIEGLKKLGEFEEVTLETIFPY